MAASPIIGTFVLLILGAVVVGTATCLAAGLVKNALDTEIGTDYCKTFSYNVNLLTNKITNAWKSADRWILEYYGPPQFLSD